MLGLHFTPACVLLSVCSLHFTHSLHFTPGPQSAVCSPQSAVRSLRFTLTVLIIWICFFYGLSRCQIRLSTCSMSRYTNMTVFTGKKTQLNENTVNYSEMCSKCKKLSLEWEVLADFSQRYSKKRIWRNFAVESILKFTVFSKLKPERNFNREVQSVTGPESKHR